MAPIRPESGDESATQQLQIVGLIPKRVCCKQCAVPLNRPISYSIYPVDVKILHRFHN
jgi:hypothetical protein